MNVRYLIINDLSPASSLELFVPLLMTTLYHSDVTNSSSEITKGVEVTSEEDSLLDGRNGIQNARFQ